MRPGQDTNVASLVTIPYSHFSEKARWALDLAHVRYRKEKNLPGPHVTASRRRGGTRTVPVLVTRDGSFADSSDILRYLDARASNGILFPADPPARREAERLETLFDEELGRSGPVWLYHGTLHHAAFCAEIFGRTYGPKQRIAWRVLFPLTRAMIRKAYSIDASSAAHSLDRLKRLFGRVDSMLSDGRGYLVGGSFSAADLTFAALAAPVLMPPGHPVYSAEPKEFPRDMGEVMESLRRTAAGAHALRMYREHR